MKLRIWLDETVNVLYDFKGEPGTGEMTVCAGEVIAVTRQDVGEGWWEGINEKGETGLFPAAYVEVVKTPATPPGHRYSEPPPEWDQGDPWSQVVSQVPAQKPTTVPVDGTVNKEKQPYSPSDPTNDATYEADDWDDDWDEDSQEGGVGMAGPKSGSAGDVSSLGKMDGRSTVRKNFNRFTTFVKSGGESYILGNVKMNVPAEEIIRVLESPDGIQWAQPPSDYTCVIASPKKESKLKGLKSYIAYQITPSFSNTQVARRYKHFDWLYLRLTEKFTLIPIPPLPDKQLSGRYEEQFIEHRRVQLQYFMDNVCRHPVLSQCEVWMHFLTCTMKEEKRWKVGKRKAEKDELVGANYFMAIQVPESPLDLTRLEIQTETFSKFVSGMDNSVRSLNITVVDQVKKHQGAYKRELQKIGNSFRTVGQCFETDSSCPGLTNALKITGDLYDDIGKLYEDQPKLDWEPLGDVLHLYKGLLGSFPEILQVHKGALQKRRECEKSVSEGKMESSQLLDVSRRTDVVSYSLLAEINYFHQHRARGFKIGMKDFLTQQINFYQQIVGKLQLALAQYDQV